MKIVEFYSLLVVFASPVFPSNLSGFRTCISNSGTGRTCQLDSGIWDVDATLVIERNGILLQGTSGDASDVILRRSSTLGANDIMYLNSGLTTTIQYLTFDGNRQTISLCASTDPGVADLNLWDAGIATVQYVNFIDAPWRTLALRTTSSSGASTVSYSNFGQGFYAHGYSRTAQQTAGRWLAIIIGGDSTGVWSNNIAYSGMSAVQLYQGTGQYVVNNIIQNAMYEHPDGVSGGQVYIAGPGASTYASIANNYINGNYWDTTNKNTSNTDILCTPTGGLFTFGIEASGTGHRYYNNAVLQNMGWGIFLRPWDTTVGETLNSNTISGYDPFCTGGCTYVPHYVENNGGCWTRYGCYNGGFWPASYAMAGINADDHVAGPGSGTGYISNLTLDHVRSRNNARYGVALYNVTGSPGFTDSINGSNYACITGNGSTNLVTSGSASGYTSYTNLCP